MSKYDFLGQSYDDLYPNLHRYPATMLPQIGIELLRDFGAKKRNLLDPYCGSGSSFSAGLEHGIGEFFGFDLNPLAIMISKAKLSFVETSELLSQKENLESVLFEFAYDPKKTKCKNVLNLTNANFWFSDESLCELSFVFEAICSICSTNSKNLFLLAFSETLRDVSFTRNSEFKLFRMRDFESYKPNVTKIFLSNLNNIIEKYLNSYQKKVKNVKFKLANRNCDFKGKVDTILTSPPYGDSKTTVAYGQFSTFTNEWLGFSEARKLDSNLMGGKKSTKLYEKGQIKDAIYEIDKLDKKRALEVSSFYFDLENSIKTLANLVNDGGKVFFVVGNRTVKGITLETDKFIAEIFAQNGFLHLETIGRKLTNKRMPSLNSPTNIAGVLCKTMNEERIVVCKKN